MDEKLVDKEQNVNEEEVQLAALHQERLTYLFIGDEDSLKEVDKKIRTLEKKLTKKKAKLKQAKEEVRTIEHNNVELKQAKEEARTTEQNNVAGVGVVRLVDANLEATLLLPLHLMKSVLDTAD
ncbi:hypothetical protein Tco_0388980 [Tanacetum coccineum]